MEDLGSAFRGAAVLCGGHWLSFCLRTKEQRGITLAACVLDAWRESVRNASEAVHRAGLAALPLGRVAPTGDETCGGLFCQVGSWFALLVLWRSSLS
jgi:hypothetical protein